MPTYIGPDGLIHNQPVRGGMQVQPGSIAPPPGGPGNAHPIQPQPGGRGVGVFRQICFWLSAMACSYGVSRGIGLFAQNFILNNHSRDGIVGTVAGVISSATPIILYVIAFIACLCWGDTVGEDNRFNLLGLLLTVIYTGVTCLLASALLALIPYAAMLLAALLGLALVIGILCAIFGG